MCLILSVINNHVLSVAFQKQIVFTKSKSVRRGRKRSVFKMPTCRKRMQNDRICKKEKKKKEKSIVYKTFSIFVYYVCYLGPNTLSSLPFFPHLFIPQDKSVLQATSISWHFQKIKIAKKITKCFHLAISNPSHDLEEKVHLDFYFDKNLLLFRFHCCSIVSFMFFLSETKML